ncbi:DoxX family membrane protein [candidate division KSB1 bacterium]|nr:DoxX family membrane protein [candidate division KSB1 bacterium]
MLCDFVQILPVRDLKYVSEHSQSIKYVHLISSYFLGVVFLFTSIDKLFHYNEFLNALAGYVLTPPAMVSYLALPIIFTELWVGAGLLLNWWRKAAALTSASLLTVFTLALTLNYIYKPGTICGCWFTITLGTATEIHIAQNVVMLGLALTIWGLELDLTKKSASGTIHRAVSS